jgi:hypothetical protein
MAAFEGFLPWAWRAGTPRGSGVYSPRMTTRSESFAQELDDGSRAPTAPARENGFECDACGKWIDGEPGGAGLFVWTRGDEVRYEEPPLCEECASEISVGALIRWETEEEEEG